MKLLNVVVFRTSNTYAQGHIVAEGYWQAFCGESVPASIREVWNDPRNPYRNRGNATCARCVAEWRNGRTSGSSAESRAVESVSGEETES